MTYSASGPASATGHSHRPHVGLTVRRVSQPDSRVAITMIQGMARFWACFVAFAMVACGGAAEFEENEELATLEQPIYSYKQYGHEGSGAARCKPPWGGGSCNVPNNKSIRISLEMADCIDDWWRSAIIQGVASMVAHVNSLGWDVYTVFDQPVGANYSVRCGGGPADMFGQTMINTFPWPFGGYDCVDTVDGDFCQYTQGTVFIYPGNIEDAFEGWFVLSLATQRRIVLNTTRHEMGHLFGLGHTAFDGGATLMSSPTPAFCPNQPVNKCNTELYPTATEQKLMRCYNPDGNGPPQGQLPACGP